MDLQKTIPHSQMIKASANDIEIVFDTFGGSTDPPMLLIAGLGRQLIDWDERFCEQLATAGFWVIRFDNRDVGLSTHLDEAGVPRVAKLLNAAMQGQEVGFDAPYLLMDMAADALGLLDVLNIRSAHILGVSMGGAIAQTLTIEHPERVRTLISIMASNGDHALPHPTPEAAALLSTPAPNKRDPYIDYWVHVIRVLGSPGYPMDEIRVREWAERRFDRGLNPKGFARQWAAILASGSRKEQLKYVKIPTLVIHGKDDPLVPVECGIDTAAFIPGAKLMLIDGMGHELPVDVWPQLIEAIQQRTR